MGGRFLHWKTAFCGVVSAATMAAGMVAAAQEAPDYGPPPTEHEFYEAADRAAHRVFRSRIEDTAWGEPRQGSVFGHSGYIACGDVSLRDREGDPVRVAAVWRRGDVQPLLMTWRYDATDPFADQMDLPLWLVVPLRELPELCSAFSGDVPRRGQDEGESFAWGTPPQLVSAWRQVSRDTRQLDDRDDFGRVSDCIRLRTRERRRYRVTVEARIDTSLSIVRDRTCGGTVLRWNDNQSTTDLDPQVEFEGAGVVYAYIRAAPGSRGDYVLTVEEDSER